jgi:hypothetical protein
MDTGEAIELLMVAPITVGCFHCNGRGQVLPFVGERKFCFHCNGARVVINPIWKQAWMALYPEDYDGMNEKMTRAVREAWKERRLTP